MVDVMLDAGVDEYVDQTLEGRVFKDVSDRVDQRRDGLVDEVVGKTVE